ncbi:ISAs1 family transposase [Trebonia sp.]|uniref:ISAs1 family transposase n=1 Tax=Trebonia sp. TaxID=2767075 RepID=UPI0026176C8F|nr:ISAs1 family transposase [Trebonia sp.]
MPALLSSLIDASRNDLSAVLAPDGAPCPCLREWLAGIPDPRSPLGRWHPLEFVLALAVCAFTAAGYDSPSAIADWASGCSREILAVLGGRRDPWTGQVRPPCERTFRRVFTRIDAAALNGAVHGYLAAVPQAAPADLPEAARHEREQRRAAAQARRPPVPGMRPQAAADGKTVRGAVRPDGSQVHLLSAFHVGEGRTLAQREVGAKTNEIPELAPCLEGLDLAGMVVTLDALHTQRETARLLRQNHGAHYLMIAKANQPALLEQVTAALSGTDAEFADASWAEDGKGHGRREKRSIRTAPADSIDWPGAAQVLRIRRDTGPTHGPWTSKEIAYAITSLPADLAGPRHLAIYARQHWGIENRQHYTRDVTFREDAQKARTGNQPNAYAAIRNLVMGAFRREGFANIACARRYYGRGDQRILALYGYA